MVVSRVVDAFVGTDVMLRLVGVSEASADLAKAAATCASRNFLGVALEGEACAVERTYRAVTDAGERVTLLRIRIETLATYEAAASAIGWLLDKEALVEVVTCDDAVRGQAEETGVWRVVDDGPDPDLPTVRVAVHVDGHLCRVDDGRRSERSLRECSLGDTLAEIELEVSDLGAPHSVKLPMVVHWPLAPGRFRVEYRLGGVMAMGAHLDADWARVALGFSESTDDEFRAWLALLCGESDPLSIFPGIIAPRFGASRSAEVSLPVMRPPSKPEGAAVVVTVAAMIAQGRVDDVADLLGLHAGLERCTASDRKALIERGGRLLGSAIVVLAMSRVSAQLRDRAAHALSTLGTHDAKRDAQNLERMQPDLGRRVRARLTNRAGVRRRRQSRNVETTLVNVRSALSELGEVFRVALAR
ncbi:MAG: hypothetical protein ACHREM_07150 [Polyangiales bacterium]